MDCAIELSEKFSILQVKPISKGQKQCQMPQFSLTISFFFLRCCKVSQSCQLVYAKKFPNFVQRKCFYLCQENHIFSSTEELGLETKL